MIRKVVQTKDNSKTLLIEDNNDTYHSIHGALTESTHVFIKNGLLACNKKNIKVFEMGFGTGLNCFLSANQNKIDIEYHTLEKYPITQEEVIALDYNSIIEGELSTVYYKIHNCAWNKLVCITPTFKLKKIKDDLISFQLKDDFFDVIYFDAFGPKTQPKLWRLDVLNKLYNSLTPGGTFITYCAQGQFKRDLKSAGFNVTNLPGPPGKREITQGIKPLI